MIDSLFIEKDFKADFVGFDGLKHIRRNPKLDKTQGLTEVWLQAHSLAKRKEMVMVTTSHINRPGIKAAMSGEKVVYTGDDVSEDINQVNECDVWITMNTPFGSEDEVLEYGSKMIMKDQQNVVLFVDKNRQGRRYVMFEVTIDFARNSIIYNPKPKYRKVMNMGYRKIVRK